MRYTKTVAAAAGLALAAMILAWCPPAEAGTGSTPQLDTLCTHPAFVASAPTVRVNGGDPISMPLIGLRAHNSYCASSNFVNPADYGTA